MTSEITCAELVEQLTDLLDGAQDAEARRLTLDHLRDCEGCQEYLDQYRTVVTGLGALRVSDPGSLPEPVRSTVVAGLRAQGVTRGGTE